MPLALIKHPWNSHAKLTAAFAKELLLQPPSMRFWKSLPAFCEAQVCRILIKISSWEKVSEFGRKKPGVFLKGYLRGFTNKKIWWLLRKRTNSARLPISLATGSCSGGAVLGIRALCAQQERLWVPQAWLVEHHELPLGKIQSGGYVSSWGGSKFGRVKFQMFIQYPFADVQFMAVIHEFSIWDIQLKVNSLKIILKDMRLV